MNSKNTKTKAKPTDFPSYCDYKCKYAELGDPKDSRDCKKSIAVWCRFLKKYNNEHNKCLAK